MASGSSPEGAVPHAFAAWRAQPGFSFSAAAGPLPGEVAKEVAEACRHGPGSILSLPFTTPTYRSLQAETESCLRRLLAIPDDFAVLFMAGGASAQFALVPMISRPTAEVIPGCGGTMTSVTPMTLRRRDDVITDGGYADKIVSNAPLSEDNFFMVPKVVE